MTAWKLVARMIWVVFTLPFKTQSAMALSDGVPRHLQADSARFTLYWMIATVANSPAATLLFSLMAIIILAFFASVSMISQVLAVAQDHHDHRHNATT